MQLRRVVDGTRGVHGGECCGTRVAMVQAENYLFALSVEIPTNRSREDGDGGRGLRFAEWGLKGWQRSGAEWAKREAGRGLGYGRAQRVPTGLVMRCRRKASRFRGDDGTSSRPVVKTDGRWARMGRGDVEILVEEE